MDVLRREFVYIWYYFTVQLEQIFGWWVLGMVIGSTVSTFAKDYIHRAFRSLQGKRLGVLGIDGGQCTEDCVPAMYVWHDSHLRFLFQRRDEG